jgi:hypothetical protein
MGLLTAAPDWPSIFWRLNDAIHGIVPVEPDRREPVMAEAQHAPSGRRAHPEPAATDRYWTATLVEAAPPAAADEDGPTGATSAGGPAA